MASIFSLPQYVPDPTSGEVVTGYQVQSSNVSAPATLLIPNSSFSDITNSPFVSNTNIVDIAGSYNTWYRARPLRQITVNNVAYTLDTPWSKPFQPNSPMYDAVFTRLFLPTLRFVYLKDQGIAQINGTNIDETTGAGDGVWVPDGTTVRFPLQYIMNDDPIYVLDDVFTMVKKPASGSLTLLSQNVDYAVDVRNGLVEFATAPAATDYLRFQFLRTDFVNDDLLLAIASAVNSLSHYGLNGYQINNSYNLASLNVALQYPDLADIIAKLAMIRMREGMTENAMRGTTAWRDGNASADPYPSRALEFLVTKLQVNEDSLRRDINTFIKATTTTVRRGELEIFYDMSQLTPVTSGMFNSLPGMFGAGVGSGYHPWWV